MLDRSDVRRPAQVNACFEGGTSQRDQIVAALKGVGLQDNQITVIDRPDPEDTDIALEEPGFLDRIKALFGKGDTSDDEEHKNYDLLILAHLGNDDELAGPVQDVFKRFNAARVNYYPVAEVEMHALGEGGPGVGARLVPVADTDVAHTGTTGPGATGATATATDATVVRVEPGEVGYGETIHVATAGESGERVERHEEIVIRGETGGVVEESTTTTMPTATGRDATGRENRRT